MGQGREDLLWPLKRSLGLLPRKPSLLPQQLSLAAVPALPLILLLTFQLLSYWHHLVLLPLLFLLLLLLPLLPACRLPRPLHQTEVNPPAPMSWQWCTALNGQQGLKIWRG